MFTKGEKGGIGTFCLPPNVPMPLEISHSYLGLKIFEVSTHKKLPELDLDTLQNRLIMI